MASSKPEDGYNAATDRGGSFITPMTFEGKDKDGKKAQFKIHLSAAPGSQTLYVLKQVEVAHGSVVDADVAAA